MFNFIIKIIFIVSLFFTSLVITSEDNNASASQEPIGPWTLENYLPLSLASNQAFAHSGYLYTVGGGSSTHINDVHMSSAGFNGALSSWSKVSQIPKRLAWHSYAKNDNFVYILGGIVPFPSTSSPTSSDSVYLGVVSPSGNIDGWSDLPPLPKRLSLGGSIINNNKIYFMGGVVRTPGDPWIYNQEVYVADIYPDGNISDWSATLSLPTSIFSFSIFTSNNKLIVAGGRTPSSSATDKVYEGVIGGNGEITSWVEISSLPERLRRPGFISTNKYFILAGGHNGMNFTNNVYYSKISADGSPGKWTLSTNSLLRSSCCYPLVSSSGYLYAIGGHDGGYFNTVYKAKLAGQGEYLDVPDLKQYDPPWNDDVYDDADKWSPLADTIERWGCTLTSASMVLQYHGHDIDPGALNDWLNLEPDGYVRNGLVNWLAISRYTLLHPSPSDSPALEFRRYSAGNADLTAEFEAERPPILKVPGHFVVGKGEQDDDIVINDPASSNELFSDLGKSLVSVGTYIPSETDLSYIMLVVNEDVNISVTNSAGVEVGESFSEGPILDDTDESEESGETVSMYLLPKPIDGQYRIALSGQSGVYDMDAYVYDPLGDVEMFDVEGLLSESGEEIGLLVDFDGGSSVDKEISFESIRQDIREAYMSGLIYKRNIYKLLWRRVGRAERQYGKGKTKVAVRMLKTTNRLLAIFNPRFVDRGVSMLLQGEITHLAEEL